MLKVDVASGRESLDVDMIWCSKSQLSYTRSVPWVPNLMTGQGAVVTARVYRVCYCVSVGCGLAMECWL